MKNHKRLFLCGTLLIPTFLLLSSCNCNQKNISKYDFDPNMPFDLKYTRSVKIHGNREKIMVLTDLHFHGTPDVDMENEDKITITSEVDNYNPDLILILGDSIDDHSNPNGFSPERWYENQKNFIEFIDTFKTPWAPIFGNHETEKGHSDGPYEQPSKSQLADLFSHSKYCLFQYGPTQINDGWTGGAGNYCINLTKNKKIIHSFIMMDTCVGLTWEHCFTSDKQIQWYEWMQNGLINAKNKCDDWTTTLCTHVPLEKFVDFSSSDTDHCQYLYGEKEGNIDVQETPQGSINFWDKIVSIGHVDQVISGHDHKNDFSFIHKTDNIQLTYAVKSRRNWNGDDQSTKDYDPKMLGFLAISINTKNKIFQENHLTSFS